MFVAHGNSLKTWLASRYLLRFRTVIPGSLVTLTQRGRAAILDFESGDFEIVRRLKMLGAKDAEIDGRSCAAPTPGAHLNDPETWIALAELGLGLLVVDSRSTPHPLPPTRTTHARRACCSTRAGSRMRPGAP